MIGTLESVVLDVGVSDLDQAQTQVLGLGATC
jgi:hypothetical protein